MSDPRVEDRLELGLDGLLLSQTEVFVLERVGLSCDGVQLLGQGNDLLELVDRVDSLSDGLGVLGPGRVKDTFDSLRGRSVKAPRHHDGDPTMLLTTHVDVAVGP